MRSSIPLCLLLAQAFALLALGGGCANTQEMDLSFFNAGARPLFVQAGADTGMYVSIEVDLDGQWLLAWPSLGQLCLPRCGALESPVCAAVVPETEVVQAIAGRRTVTRHLEGTWWVESPGEGCARPAPMRGDLRVGICHDDVAIDSQTGDIIEAPEISGLVGVDGGAHLLDPFCETFPLDLWLASADSFDVRAE